MTYLEKMLVEDVLQRWPATMRAFLDHRMHCIGCPISCLHTVKDACREHAVDLGAFEADIRAVIKAGSNQHPAKPSDAQTAAH